MSEDRVAMLMPSWIEPLRGSRTNSGIRRAAADVAAHRTVDIGIRGRRIFDRSAVADMIWPD